jgi:signal transduction histidine kinase
MNSEPVGDGLIDDSMTRAPLTNADRPISIALDAELEAAQRELASEHARVIDALANAESALAMRDEVLAIVAHDLRAPLNAVQTSAAVLMDVDLAEHERRRLLEVIRRASSGMNRLIEDLLDVARIESGAFIVELQRTDLGALVIEVCDQFRSEAAKAGVTLEFEVERNLPQVAIDRDRMPRVLQNLIGNALKFTPAGGRLTVRVAREGTDGVSCSVVDTGIGIPSEELPRLFERFWQARRYRRGGAGLGLAIARGVVEAHGSRLSVESEVGRGTVFSFVIR